MNERVSDERLAEMLECIRRAQSYQEPATEMHVETATLVVTLRDLVDARIAVAAAIRELREARATIARLEADLDALQQRWDQATARREACEEVAAALEAEAQEARDASATQPYVGHHAAERAYDAAACIARRIGEGR